MINNINYPVIREALALNFEDPPTQKFYYKYSTKLPLPLK